MPDEGKLGIIAGAGQLPQLIIQEAFRRQRPLFVVGFEGHADPAQLAGVPHKMIRLGKGGAILKALRHENVRDIVMVGGVRRPSLAELRPDWYTVRFFARLGRTAWGDDGLLRAVAALMEKEGFRVVGAAQVLGNLTVEPGILGSVYPSDAHMHDIETGIRIVAGIGLLDIGQAAVIQQNIILGVEGVEGTDELILRCGKLARAGARPVLVKLAKPQQDMRLDLPTIGPGTIASLAKAGFAGIAIEAGRTIVLDTTATIAAADSHGIFITAVTVS